MNVPQANRKHCSLKVSSTCMLVSQSCLDSVRPHGLQPARLPIHGIFQARILESGAISFSQEAPHTFG